ncbi:MAG: YfiR family protein [Desulfobulbaceae bacterium]|nr:YfiR family protein [Desulfobulbaceae bacterium]HIJ78149.1 YfiR family protein [Deltaproteobacteria bacterium]
MLSYPAGSWAAPVQHIAFNQEQQIQEYELKAVYLYNFLNFIHWPTSPGSEDLGPMVIGIVGKSPFGNALEALKVSLEVAGKPTIAIKEFGPYRSGMNLTACNLLFISASETQNFKNIIEELQQSPVLTVADTQDFIKAGGMINMIKHEGKIRWEINRAATNNANLRVSSQLLKIAIKTFE